MEASTIFLNFQILVHLHPLPIQVLIIADGPTEGHGKTEMVYWNFHTLHLHFSY